MTGERIGGFEIIAEIGRGGELYTSGMVLVTPLKVEVQEDEVSGRVRVNVMDRATGAYLKDVHVKVIGSENTDFLSGETDLRGIFVADGIRGRATVIARDTKGQFAFHRGKAPLMKRPEAQRGRGAPAGQVEYGANVMLSNTERQDLRKGGQLRLYQQKRTGVEAQTLY